MVGSKLENVVFLLSSPESSSQDLYMLHLPDFLDLKSSLEEHGHSACSQSRQISQLIAESITPWTNEFIPLHH